VFGVRAEWGGDLGEVQVMRLVEHFIPTIGTPRGVIHVGGFDGNEERWYREWGARSVWFEPVPEKFAELQAKGLHAYECALGSRPGRASLNLSASLQCCSLLEPSGHLDQYPQFPFSGSIEVEVRTLDSFALTGFDMLVLDVQGYELEVLKGAVETLKQIRIIYCEVSIIELYRDAPMFHEIHRTLSPQFEFLGIDWVDGINKGWGDALFVRR
jgi:FkbM family methyltransferase